MASKYSLMAFQFLCVMNNILYLAQMFGDIWFFFLRCLFFVVWIYPYSNLFFIPIRCKSRLHGFSECYSINRLSESHFDTYIDCMHHILIQRSQSTAFVLCALYSFVLFVNSFYGFLLAKKKHFFLFNDVIHLKAHQSRFSLVQRLLHSYDILKGEEMSFHVYSEDNFRHLNYITRYWAQDRATHYFIKMKCEFDELMIALCIGIGIDETYLVYNLLSIQYCVAGFLFA